MRIAGMKLSFRYGDRTSQYVLDDDMKNKVHNTLLGERVPDDDEFLIDLTTTDPAEIAKYREFANKNKELYDHRYAEEMFVQTHCHVHGDPKAKAEAELLFRTHLDITGQDRPADFEPYFARFLEMYEQRMDADKGGLTRISFDYGELKSQYVVDEKADKVKHYLTEDGSSEEGEFVINVGETDPKEIARYERFIDANQKRYSDLFGREMANHASIYGDGVQQAKDYAQLLFEMNQRFKKTAIALANLEVNFENYFEMYVERAERMKDMFDKNLKRVSFGFGLSRSQYVVEKGSDEHKKHYIIVGDPPYPDEFIIDVDETDPGKIKEYRKFVLENKELYKNLSVMEMYSLTQRHLNGNKTAKGLAKKLFEINCNFYKGPKKSEFEGFFAKLEKVIKKEE